METQHDPGQVIHGDWIQQQGFTQTENVVLRDKSLSVQARLLYTLLKMYAWQKGSAFPGQETLAELMGLKVRMVQIYLKELIDAGLVERKQRGLNKSNLYILLPLGAKYCVSDPQYITGQDAQSVTGQDMQPITHEEDTSKKTQTKKTQSEGASAPAQRSTPQDDALFNAPKITLVNHNPVTSPVTSGRKLTPGVNAPRRAKQIPLPANYPLTEEMRAWAAMEYPALGERIDTEHKKFCNHARSTGKLLAEWRPAWETWMINAVGDFAPKAQGGTTRGHYESKGERAARNLRLLAEECATAAEDDQGANHQESSRLLA